MKKTLMSVGVLAIAALTTCATASASPCATGNNLLSQYVGNSTTAPSGGLSSTGTFSCSLGSANFSNFSSCSTQGASRSAPSP
jgi:hypothetical protein